MTDPKPAPRSAIQPGAESAARAQLLLSAIDALLALEEANRFMDHAYAPGAYIPSADDERFLLEGPTAAATVVNLGARPEPAPPEPAPPVPEPTLGLEELLLVARALETPPLNEGLHDLPLRRGARELPNPSDLVEALGTGDLVRARELLTAWRNATHDLLAATDERLRDLTQAPKPAVNDTVESRVLRRLDEILTASAMRLQGELFAMSVQAQGKHGVMSRLHTDYDNARAALIALTHPFTAAVARLAMKWERRDPVQDVLAQFDDLERKAQGHQAQILQIEREATGIDRSFEDLRQLYLPLRMQADALLISLRELEEAARVFNATLPMEVVNQIAHVRDPLDETLRQCADQFTPMPVPQMDGNLSRALDEINAQRARRQHLLNPIRPSVFKTRLDREEEVRRLVLIGFHLLTNFDINGRPHTGRGKVSGVKVLVTASLLDASEMERAVETVTQYKDAKPKLMEAVPFRGRGWCYLPTKEGRAQALVWLSECIDHDVLARQIDDARRTANADFKARRAPREE